MWFYLTPITITQRTYNIKQTDAYNACRHKQTARDSILPRNMESRDVCLRLHYYDYLVTPMQ